MTVAKCRRTVVFEYEYPIDGVWTEDEVILIEQEGYGDTLEFLLENVVDESVEVEFVDEPD